MIVRLYRSGKQYIYHFNFIPLFQHNLRLNDFRIALAVLLVTLAVCFVPANFLLPMLPLARRVTIMGGAICTLYKAVFCLCIALRSVAGYPGNPTWYVPLRGQNVIESWNTLPGAAPDGETSGFPAPPGRASLRARSSLTRHTSRTRERGDSKTKKARDAPTKSLIGGEFGTIKYFKICV